MKLSTWMKQQAAMAADPEVCTLPDEEDCTEAGIAIAITAMGCHCEAGQHGYLQQLANDPEVSVACDALQMLEPRHPGSDAAEEDGEEWEKYAAARFAWNSLINAFPVAWLQFHKPSQAQIEARQEKAMKAEAEAQSPWA